MVSIGEATKKEPVFEGVEQVKTEDILGEKLEIEAYKIMQGDTGDFAVIKAKHGKKTVSFSNGGSVIIDKLERTADYFNIEDKDDVVVFPEPVICKIVKVKSKETGQSYYNFEDVE